MEEKSPEQIVDLVPAPASGVLSDGGASFAERLSQKSWAEMLRKLYGAALTLVALAGLGGLGLAYLPFAPEPEAQHAAAAETVNEPNPFENVAIQARAAYVYDVTSGAEQYAKEPMLQLPLASLTKVMLVLAVSEVLAPDDIIPITRSALEKGEGGLTWGEEWLERDLVDFTLITSSNTGAEALAEAADAALREKYPKAPRGGAAVWRMNALAQEMGLNETYFMNASGLDAGTSQASALGSARDIARLFTYALETAPELFVGTTREIEALAPLNFPGRIATNTNNALADIPGILMGKTGTTDLAGGNLAVAFEAAPGRPVVIVVLGSTVDGRYDDMRALVEAAQKKAAR